MEQVPVDQQRTLVSVGQDICGFLRKRVPLADLLREMDSKQPRSSSREFVKVAARDLCPSAAPVKPHAVARFSGDGIENTARFQITGSGEWVLKYTYDCSSFGSEGNFIVDEDGGSDFNGASVNELGPGGHGKTHVYGDAGSHWLAVNSECAWTVEVVQH